MLPDGKHDRAARVHDHAEGDAWRAGGIASVRAWPAEAITPRGDHEPGETTTPTGQRRIGPATSRSLPSLSLKEPVDAVLVGKMSVSPKRHVLQIVQELLICPH